MTNIIAFIGGGNMARSLIGGLIAQGHASAHIRVAEPIAALREALHADFGITVFETAAEAISNTDCWVLATKPQVLRGVCETLAAQAQAMRPLIVSIAAGITAAQIERWLGGDLPVVRTMPNTPALLGAGVTGLFASARVDTESRRFTNRLLTSAGKTVWIDDETQMDAVTAVSGSGPAYVFLLAEAMINAGVREGLPADAARILTLQTVLGAARMLTESNVEPTELRHRVTSPNGTTQAAVDAFEAGGLRALVDTAIHAARLRGAALSAAND